MDNVTYKVLWIEDDDKLTVFESEADAVGIELQRVDNLEDGMHLLKSNFKDYSAIILDAFCKVKNDSKIPENKFLARAAMELSSIFAEKREPKPWYVLSEGTMVHYDLMLDAINWDERKKYEKEWGRLNYKKSIKERDELFENIKRVASTQIFNKVIYRHPELFNLLGEGKLIPNQDARNIVLRLLSYLYFPEDAPNFELETNPVRKVIECLFYAIREKGLLPDECFEPKYSNLDCWRYITGQEVRRETPTKKVTIRFGEKGECILSTVHHEELKDLSQLLINYEAIGCHVVNGKLSVDEDERELFYGYVMILIHLIKQIGKYVDNHQDVNENIQKCSRREESKTASSVGEEIKQNYVNKEFFPERDENGIWYCGECAFLVKRWNHISKILIHELTLNTSETKDRYPYFVAKFDNVE